MLIRKSGDMLFPCDRHTFALRSLCHDTESSLKGPAQKAVDFIVDAQNKAGGWRYEPEATRWEPVRGSSRVAN